MAEPTDIREAWKQRLLQSVESRDPEGAHDAVDRICGNADPTEAPPEEVTWADAKKMAEPLPALSYFVPELALVSGPGAPHMVGGFGYSGKTMAMQSLLVSLANGSQVWGGYRTGGRFKCAHVDYEQGERLTWLRYQRLARGMGLDLAELTGQLRSVSYPKLRLRVQHRGAWERMMAETDIIVIDSLRAAAGGEENSSAFREGLDMLGELSDATGCRAVVIHHARKPTEGAPAGGRYSLRGSGAIFDALDGCYILSGEKGEPTRCQHEKARSHGELVEDWALIIRDVELDGEAKAGLEVCMRGAELIEDRREKANEERKRLQVAADIALMVRTMTASPGLGTRDLRALAGLSVPRFTRAMAELGDKVEKREECEGKSRRVAHFYRGR